MTKLLTSLILLCCAQTVLNAQTASPDSFSVVISEINFYHEMKDSLPLYVARINAGKYNTSDVIKFVRLSNTISFYVSTIQYTQTLGHNGFIYTDIARAAEKRLVSEYEKSRVVSSGRTLIVNSSSNLPVCYMYLIELDIIKQIKIKKIGRCIDIASSFRPTAIKKEEWEDFEKKLEKQNFYWSDDKTYFLPLEEWFTFISDQQIQEFIDKYESTYLKMRKAEGWIYIYPIEY